MTLVTPPSGPDFDVTDYEALAYYRREPGYVVHDGVSGPASTAPTLPLWAASTSYKAGQEIWISAGTVAVAQSTHLSGSTYAADKTAGKWVEVAGGGTSVTGGPIVVSDTRPSSPTTGTVRIGLAYDGTAPSVPTGLAATPGNTTVALSWTASTDNVAVTGYNVRRGGTIVGTPATNSYTDTGLTNGTTYSYTVSAFDAAGNESAQTSSVNGTPSAPATTLATDNFNRADGSPLGTSSGGQTWSAIVGTVGIRSNAAGAYSGDPEISVIDVSNANVTVQATITAVSGSGPALIVRCSDSSNYWQAEKGQIKKVVAGSPTPTTYTGSVVFASGDVMAVVCSGNSVIVKKNGTTIASITDSFNSTATKHGVEFGADVTQRIDDFSITTP